MAAIPLPAAGLITAYDKFGREIQISRAQWLEGVLQPSLLQHWNDAGQLYDLIIGALADGFAAQVLDASARQLELDQAAMPERGYVVRGIVLLENGRLDDAEAVLAEGIRKLGETAPLLVNLAKVHARRGATTQADALLWAGVLRDPNLEHGLAWWLALQKERGGDPAYQEGLARTARLPGAWRPQLWLARERLAAGAVDDAVALYRQVLSGRHDEPAALMMISGDLGSHGQVALIPELIAAAYQPGAHDPGAGINLLHAYLELGRWREGEALLKQLYPLERAGDKAQLDGFSDAFARLKAASEPPRPVDLAALQVESVTFTQPVWAYGLEQADWLFRAKDPQAPVVAFLALSKRGFAPERAEQQREDDTGRLTRAIALYLAESTHYWTGFAGHTWVSVVKDGGPVVFGADADGAEVAAVMPTSVQYFVTGSIVAEAGKVGVTLQLWDRAKCSRVARESVTVKSDAIGSAVLVLEKRLLAHLGGAWPQAFDAFYQRPPPEAIGPYLVGLGHAFMLTGVGNGFGSRERLWGERGILELPLTMALQWWAAEVPKIMLLSALGKAFQYQSELLPEFRQRTLAFMKDAVRDHSVVAGLQPLVWKIFGMQAELAAFVRDNASRVDAGYAAWLQRLLQAR